MLSYSYVCFCKRNKTMFGREIIAAYLPIFIGHRSNISYNVSLKHYTQSDA